MLSQIRRKSSGMVLLTVIMVIMVMSLLLTAIISQNLSQSSVGQFYVDSIKAQELAVGAFWKAQADMTYASGDPTVSSETIDGKTFTVAVDARQSTAVDRHPPYHVTVSF